MMRKHYIQPVCEEINVHLTGSVLDGAEVGGGRISQPATIRAANMPTATATPLTMRRPMTAIRMITGAA